MTLQCVIPIAVINPNSDFVCNKQTSSPLSMINSEDMCYLGITDKYERTSSIVFILFTVNLLPRDQTKRINNAEVEILSTYIAHFTIHILRNIYKRSLCPKEAQSYYLNISRRMVLQCLEIEHWFLYSHSAPKE